METGLEALEEAGLRPSAARTAWTALIGLTYGHVAYQLAGHMRGPTPGSAEVDADSFPRVAAAAAAQFDWDRAFEQALDSLIQALLRGR